MQHRTQRVDDLDEPGVVQVGDQHPDGARAQGRQRPGCPVGPVAELQAASSIRRRLITLRCCSGQRDQRLGHAGAGGHVDDGRPARRLRHDAQPRRAAVDAGDGGDLVPAAVGGGALGRGHHLGRRQGVVDRAVLALATGDGDQERWPR